MFGMDTSSAIEGARLSAASTDAEEFVARWMYQCAVSCLKSEQTTCGRSLASGRVASRRHPKTLPCWSALDVLSLLLTSTRIRP